MHTMRTACALVAVVLPAVAVAADDPGYVVAAKDGGVWENSIAISPANPMNAVAIGVVGGGGSVQTFYTEDGSRTWHYGGALGLTTAKRTYMRHGDPVVASDRRGVMYVSTLIGSPRSYPLTYSGIAVYRSFDNGKTWDGPYGVVERAPEDKPVVYSDDKEWIAVDATGGPHDGNVYVAWLRVPVSNTQQVEAIFSRSTDGGVTWSPELNLGAGSGGQISIGPNGEVILLRTCGDGYYCSQVSLDGGVSFQAPVRIARSATFLANAVDISNGPHRGNIYTAWIASITGPQLSRSFVGTVYYSRSTDNGKTWETPVAITPVNGSTGLFQTIACDPISGDVVIAWLDRRANPQGKSFRLYMTRSTDGGKTFSEQKAVTEPVDMNATGFIGDYNQMTAFGRVFLAAFSDGKGLMSVSRIAFETPNETGPRRRSTRK
jgi:hypothetical protein